MAGGYGVNGSATDRSATSPVDARSPTSPLIRRRSQTDGFGFGGFGYGGFGQAAGTYTWTSNPLSSGNWSYAVVPYDSAGNVGTPGSSRHDQVPAARAGGFSDETRLHYTYDAID